MWAARSSLDSGKASATRSSFHLNRLMWFAARNGAMAGLISWKKKSFCLKWVQRRYDDQKRPHRPQRKQEATLSIPISNKLVSVCLFSTRNRFGKLAERQKIIKLQKPMVVQRNRALARLCGSFCVPEIKWPGPNRTPAPASDVEPRKAKRRRRKPKGWRH